MLVKMNFADFLQESIHSGKELQKKIQGEPDPEEKDDNQAEIHQTHEEKLLSDALYNSVLKAQYQLETNGVFNVQLSGTTFTSGFFSGNQLYTANVGDSRVIVISVDDTPQPPGSPTQGVSTAGGLRVAARQATHDHKPDS